MAATARQTRHAEAGSEAAGSDAADVAKHLSYLYQCPLMKGVLVVPRGQHVEEVIRAERNWKPTVAQFLGFQRENVSHCVPDGK